MEFTSRALGGGASPFRDTMQVCLDGHVITDEFYGDALARKARCPEDGQPTITECPSCLSAIPGKVQDPELWDASGILMDVPQYCERAECGKAFPWTGKATAKFEAEALEATLRRIFDKLDDVARQLRQRHDGRATLDVNDEYDVQDLLHSLLRLYFDDIRPEEWTPSYAGKSARMDFLLKREQAVIETKMGRQRLTPSVLGDELIVDIARYQVHPDCKSLWCFVYDPKAYISNPSGIEQDLSGERDGFTVHVVIRR